MKTFPAIYIDPQGEAKYIPEYPDESEVPRYTFKNVCDCAICQDYRLAIAAAKESAINVQCDRAASEMMANNFGYIKVKDTIHRLPEGWRVEVKEKERVAVLIPPSEIKIDRLGNTDRPVVEDESQEEIWEEVGKNRDFYGNAVWLKRVQEQFTIQRRP